MLGDVESISDSVLQLGLLELVKLRLVKPVFVATPAAGAEWTQTVPAGVIWEVVSIQETLVTSAVVANRTQQWTLTDGSTEVLRQASNTTTGASTTQRTGWQQLLGAIVSPSGITLLPLGVVIAQAGYVFKSTTALIDVADQYSSIVFQVREWSVDQVRQMARWFARNVAPHGLDI